MTPKVRRLHLAPSSETNKEIQVICVPLPILSVSHVISGFPAPQGLKEAVAALCLDNCPSLKSDWFPALSPSVQKPSGLFGDLQENIHLTVCSYTYDCIRTHHCACDLTIVCVCILQTSGNNFIDLFGCEVLFNIHKKILLFLLTFSPQFKYQIVLIIAPREDKFFGGGDGRQRLRERKPSSSRGRGAGAEKPSGNLKNIFISPFNSPPFWLKSSDPLPRPRSIIPSIFSQKLSPPLAEPQPHPEPLARLFSVSLFFPQFLPASFINLPWRWSVQAGGSLNTMQPENFCLSLHMLLSALIPIRGGWHTVLFIPISSWIHLPRNELHK